MKFKIGHIYRIENHSMNWEMVANYLRRDINSVSEGHIFKILLYEGYLGLNFKVNGIYNPTKDFYETEHFHVNEIGTNENHPEYFL